MPISYIPYFPNTIEGQAILDNFTRTARLLRYRDNDRVIDRIKRGLPLYEVEKLETVGTSDKATSGVLLRGECLSACAYLKSQNTKIDLVYIDPPFASGADYAKKVYLRRNPHVADMIQKAEEELDLDELRAFEEKMYGDIWNKEDYLNWMYENLLAIKSVMSETASIYVHLDWHIGHYVKILMDEVFGEDNFVNEIVWCYSRPSVSNQKHFTKLHDTLFWYAKNKDEGYSANMNSVRIEYSEKTKERNKYGSGGSKYSGNSTERVTHDEGKIPEDYWYIPMVVGNANENADYSTQKPEALLERIIKASSNEGMVVADFFGGSGVTAAVAHKLGRKFIHVDVGINSIQTTRDRLLALGANFEVLEVKDGVSLYRNPQQTMDKLKSLITGLRNEDALDSFWEGAISDSKYGKMPVYVPNLLDHNSKVLDIPLMNRILNEAMPDLDTDIKRVVVYYVDITDSQEIEKFIRNHNPTTIEVDLRDLKELLSEVVIDDIVSYELTETGEGFEVEITQFISDRLSQKISEYNEKRKLGKSQKDVVTAIDEEETTKPKSKFKPIEISENGLELIEWVSLDCTNADGAWKSDAEIKIDKLGYMVLNGKKTKVLWDAKIQSAEKPLRLKIRNIAGDESVVLL
ncbi:DNA methyltransferase [Runella salmonicolor]|uniref:site-specific DNA-methyltransferase (adenine-specific) n=1 Tax=Runella salmonicolor TaxID=2950278 RepID=A0ABT1FH47_9BACT|nr:site-specific DNA-methyltransferase [Runella salmonicolor]MCP1381085.1 site-specific DNA-methyltransferase [Runella salmonicolor]